MAACVSCSLVCIFNKLLETKHIYLCFAFRSTMNRLSIVKKLESQQSAVFTRQQFAVLTGKDPDAAAVLLSRMVKEGIIVRVMRGKYCLPETNPLSVASGLYAPSYVSRWSAYEYYGITTQMPRIIEVVNCAHSGNLRLDLESGTYQVSFIKTKPSWVFGVKKERLGGKVALIAEKERAIIDGLLFGTLVPIDEIFAFLSSGIDRSKIIGYANRIGKQSLMKRLGYLLSRSGLDCDPKDFGELSKTYVPLDPLNPRRGIFDSNWRIIVNVAINEIW